MRIFLSIAISITIVVPTMSSAQEPPIFFQLGHAEKAPQSGRVFLVLSKKAFTGVFSQGWFTPEPFFAQDVAKWPANEALTFQPTAAFPEPIADLKAGTYFAQAILDRRGGISALGSPGNLYSKPQKVEIDPKNPAKISLTLDQVVPERKFAEKDRIKYFELDSPLLTKFHGKPTKLRAGVVLPKSFDEGKDRTYPVVYEIPGFGGDHHHAASAVGRDHGGVDMIHVMLDANCPRGHHVFADSANNGPVGTALVKEFIPALEKTFRGSGKRLVTGHSSGGWSSLWLQVAYPDTFHGVWSTAPDSVDFRDFQKTNVYAKGANLFVDEKGQPRPLARKTTMTYKRFSDVEAVLGRGGQLFSFEAVFSPRGDDGEPRQLWDRKTGAIDPDVAKAWEAYDIRLILEKNWPTLGPKLKGKLHVYMGSEDTFYLEGATRLLKASLEKLGSDAVIEIFPGRSHGTLVDVALRKRIFKEMADAVK